MSVLKRVVSASGAIMRVIIGAGAITLLVVGLKNKSITNPDDTGSEKTGMPEEHK